MCGIVGACASWLSTKEVGLVRDLFVVSNFRGWEGAGAVISNNKGEVKTVKTVGTGVDLVYGKDSAEFNAALKIGNNPAPSVIIGHTRWPTKGAVSLEATHPHSYDGIYGVHNGTVDKIGDKYIPKEVSDSALLYEAIARYGVKEVIPTVKGAYALVWIDEKEKTLNFLRNSKRPLSFAVVDGGTALYWASEAGMLHYVLGRQGIKFDVHTLKEDTHVAYDLPLPGNLNKAGHTISELKGAPEVAYHAPFLGSSEAFSPAPGDRSEQEAEIVKDYVAKARYSDLVWDRNRNHWRLTNRAFQSLLSSGSLKTTTGGTSSTTTTPMLSSPKPSSTSQTEKTSQTSGTPSTDSAPTTINLCVGEGKQPVAFPESSSENPWDDDYDAEGALRDIDRLFPPAKPEAQEVYRQTQKESWVSGALYRDYLSRGCVWCGDPGDDVKTHIWVTPNEFMCKTCQQDEYAANYCGELYGIDINNSKSKSKKKAA